MRVFAQVLPGSRPVPFHLGGVFSGKFADMAGLAGHGIGVGIDAFIFVQVLRMAVGAVHLVLGYPR